MNSDLLSLILLDRDDNVRTFGDLANAESGREMEASFQAKTIVPVSPASFSCLRLRGR